LAADHFCDRGLRNLAFDMGIRKQERLAQVIELRYFGGLTYDQIAEAVGTSAATVDREYLALSQEVGKIAIVVRGLGDSEVHAMEMASFKKLFTPK